MTLLQSCLDTNLGNIILSLFKNDELHFPVKTTWKIGYIQ